MNAAAASSAHPMPSCTARRESEATTPAPIHPPSHADHDEHRHLPGIDVDDADEEQRLRQYRQRVTDDERSRDQLVGNQAEEPKDRGGGRERADAERVEEIRDESDEQDRAASAPRRPPARAATRRVSIVQRTTSSRPLAASAPSRIRYECHVVRRGDAILRMRYSIASRGAA